MKSRRNFIKKSILGAASLTLFPSYSFASLSSKDIQLTILHTNDMHSHIHPFTNGRNKGLGGMAQRASMINKIRNENNEILLLDAGDIFQGTPYFNMYEGELEFKLMSKMGYDAATIGNHDLDNGIDGLVKQIQHANFPFIISNYDFSKTKMNKHHVKFKVFNKSGIKVGVFGVGIELEGLVPKSLYGNTIYQDPIEISNYYANHLKNDLNCDLVICLSHLGFKYKTNKISDIVLASKTRKIDLIIGGHTHTFLKKPVDVKNLDGDTIQISQVGFGGINLGRIDYIFNKKRSIRIIKNNVIAIKNKKK